MSPHQWAWSLFLHHPRDLCGPPFICGCPVNNPACSQLLTCLAQQFDALLTYLAALILPALFPRTCLAISLMVDYFGFEPLGTSPPACHGALGASVPPGLGTSLHQASCSGQPQTAYQPPLPASPSPAAKYPQPSPLPGLLLLLQLTNCDAAHPCPLHCNSQTALIPVLHLQVFRSSLTFLSLVFPSVEWE